MGKRYDRLCVYAHNDRWNRVDEHVFYYLNSLAQEGFDILFISTSNSIHKEDVARLNQFCFESWVRENRGLDFGSFQAGLAEHAKDPRYRQFLLANDSVYGPLYPLTPIFKEMKNRQLDVWGMTDSIQHEYHLQSYFLVIERAAFEHKLMKRFWGRHRIRSRDKEAIIREYEIGFSRVCKKASLRMGAWVDYREVARVALEKMTARLVLQRECRELKSPLTVKTDNLVDILAEDAQWGFSRHLLVSACNPCHELWNYLITDFHHPFLKVALLRENPVRVQNLWQLDSVLPDTYPVALIKNHLRRVG